MTSFHVVLPSNSSMNLFPKNSLADFRVRLTKPIIVHGQYEVALEEIVYPQMNFSFKADEVHMDIYDRKDSVGGTGTSEIIFKERLKFSFPSKVGIKTLVWYINQKLKKYNWLLTFNKHGNFKFVYTAGDEVVKMVVLHPQLAYVLGFVREPYPKKLYHHEEKSVLPSQLFAEYGQMYVYADIVDFQHVGDTMAPLLRICITNLNSMEASQSERYIRPYYVPVAKQRIEEIHVQVRTHTGGLFPFPRGAPLICKLHFRPKQK